MYGSEIVRVKYEMKVNRRILSIESKNINKQGGNGNFGRARISKKS